MLKNFIVYIASPYTQGDNFVNVQRQVTCANYLMDQGITAFAPLVHSCLLHMQKDRDAEEWLVHDFAYLSRCNALLRLEGASTGADKETAKAQELGIPVFYTTAALIQYIKKEVQGNDKT